jgi:endonuclease/exonuclease/phosphatase family metal-dependent hydrolase
MKGLSIFNKVLFIINFFFLILLLLSYTAPFISPSLFWPIAFLGLLFPVLYLINLFFLMFWVFKLRKLIWPNIIVLLLGIGFVDSFIGVSLNKKKSQETLKIMSYNVRLFNKNKNIPKLKIKEKIFDLIEKENPDIICFQEFYFDSIASFNHRYIYKNHSQKNSLLSIYSKYPIIQDTNYKSFNENIGNMKNTFIFSDIKIKKDTVRIYNLHLASNWFNESEYDFMQNPNKNDLKTGTVSIIKRMKKSYLKRSVQVEIIKDHINKSPYPVIICGDFNDTPLSYSYNHIKGKLKDAFNSSGIGIGSTLTEIPALRIDYIFHDKNFESANYKKINKKLSDHFAISCELKIKKN